MTGASAAPTSVALTPRQIWTRVRGLLLALLVLVAAGVALASFRSGDQHGRLDPRSADPYGSRAVAELLRDRGVSVHVATTLADATAGLGPDATLLVTAPNLLSPGQRNELRAAADASAGRTVLLAADTPSLRTLAPGVTAKPAGPVAARTPACSLPAARSAGRAETGGLRYAAHGRNATGCFPDGGLPTMLLVERGPGETVLLGSPDLLHNARLAHQGNASLALQLLGSRPRLIWYLPSLADLPAAAEGGGGSPDTGTADLSIGDLIPGGWLWASLQLALAAVLAALWRARRLGPLVAENLPVAVRASESTEGLARLYRKANARDRAADSLRSATRTRIAPLIGVSPHDAHSPSVLVHALSARLNSTDDSPQTVLFGPAPSDDAALVQLADRLDSLEREVRTS
ncbi:DUF4350 domain-containing protein [Streptomyces sp. NPDC058195]|uniref:DUF4350 domain-containing protein n=1 Tax=Streptomyces sp. NPDC058195 TaxID=3346375 RepID=UPI0036EEC78D